MTQRVAVVGAGVSGLTAAYLLQRAYDVTLFEADDRLGGHAHTHDLAGSRGQLIPVDSGFIVHNERTYPHLLRLFRELGVSTQDSEMSMSVSCSDCGLEYAGARGISGIVATPGAAARPRFGRLLLEVKRFHRAARQFLADGTDGTLGEFLARGHYSRYFVSHFMVPLVSAVWSSGTSDVQRYPARYLFRFLAWHGMLSVSGSPQWKTVVGGSRTYVERAAKELSAVMVSTPVRAVHRHADSVLVRDDSDQVHRFDRMVVATHADQALGLLDNPTQSEESVLGAFAYSVNSAVLHGDRTLLPRRPRAAASWNYRLSNCRAAGQRAQVTYDLGRLQRLEQNAAYLLTLNAHRPIAPDTVSARMSYRHPIYTRAAVTAQSRLGELSTGRWAFAGAYHGWGFHEDGCRSGVEAARKLGVDW